MNKTNFNSDNEAMVESKIDWRAWVPYPEGFREDIRALLDTMAEFTDLAKDIRGSDDLEKFDAFTRLAYARGLITSDEYLSIQSSKHSAA